MSRAELSICQMMLGEGSGLGQFGKGRYRVWYKRRLNKALRRAGVRMTKER